MYPKINENLCFKVRGMGKGLVIFLKKEGHLILTNKFKDGKRLCTGVVGSEKNFSKRVWVDEGMLIKYSNIYVLVGKNLVAARA